MNKPVWILCVVLGSFLLPGGIGAGMPTKQILKRLFELRGKNSECDKLSDILLQLRDGIVTIGGWDYGPGKEALDNIESVLNFPIESDGKWKRLACDIVGIKTMDDLLEVLKNGITVPIGEQLASTVLRSMREGKPQLSVYAPMFKPLVTKVSSWMSKSGYPDVWPLTDTNKKEIKKLIIEMEALDMSDLLLFGMYANDIEEYAGVPKALLESQSLDEYLTAIGQDYLLDWREYLQENYLDPLGIVKDSAKLEVLFDGIDDLIDFLDEIEALGILDLAGDQEYYNYYY